jgi:hypothetical protein
MVKYYLNILWLFFIVSCSPGDDLKIEDSTDSDNFDSETETETELESDSSVQNNYISGYLLIQGQTKHGGVIVYLEGSDKTAVTDDLGMYLFSNIPNGTYTVSASLAGYSTEESSPFELDYGEVVIVDNLMLEIQLGAMTGTALKKGQGDNSGISVMVESSSFVTITNPDGTWEIGDVPVGNYSLLFQGEGFEDTQLSDINIKADGLTDVPSVELEATTSSIEGVVELEATSDFSGVYVIVSSVIKDGFTKYTVTGDDGSYQLDGLPSGIYNVEAVSSGYFSEEILNVSVVSTETISEIDFSLETDVNNKGYYLEYVSGGSNGDDGDQEANTETLFPLPLKVKVIDLLGEGVQDVVVTYTIEAGDGLLSNVSGVTDEFGIISTELTAGSSLGDVSVVARTSAAPGAAIVFNCVVTN